MKVKLDHMGKTEYRGVCIGGPLRGQNYVHESPEFQTVAVDPPPALSLPIEDIAELDVPVKYETHYYRHEELTHGVHVWIHHTLSKEGAIELAIDGYARLWILDKYNDKDTALGETK